MTWNNIKSMLKIFKKYSFFLKVKKKQTQKKERLEKQAKENLLLLIPKNIGDRVLSACKSNIGKKV